MLITMLFYIFLHQETSKLILIINHEKNPIT
jgi:hypothetical protein